jgi:hypothetical protein
MGRTENSPPPLPESYRTHDFKPRQIIEAHIFSQTHPFVYAAERDHFYLAINSKA